MKTSCHVLSILLACLISTPTQAETEPLSSSELLEQAEQFRAQNKWEEALDVLRGVVDRASEDRRAAAEAQYRIGHYLLDMALPEQAEEELGEVIVTFSDQADLVGGARLMRLYAILFQGRDAEAIDAAWVLVQDEGVGLGARASGYVLLVSAYRRQDAFEEALSALDELDKIESRPETLTPKAQGRLARGEILLQKADHALATAVLEGLADDTAHYDPQIRNWARIRLAEVLTHESKFAEAHAACEAVLTDHATGRANDEQAGWALMWKARARMFANEVSALADAPEPALVAAALALESGHPTLAYAAYYLLGEIYARLSAEADRLVKEGQGIYAASPVASIVEDTRREQNYVHEGEGGPLMVQAMEHYRAAMELAGQFNLGHDEDARARHQCASLMRHLGMRDRAIATLRVGIRDPSQLSDAEGHLASAIGSYLEGADAEAWYLYLSNPAAHHDPTEQHVVSFFETTPGGPSSTVLSDLSGRHLRLAQFYQRAENYDEARTWFESALSLASSARRQGEALYGMVISLSSQADQLRQNRVPAAVDDLLAVAAGYAPLVENAWVAAARDGTPEDMHDAIKQILFAYRAAHAPGEAVAAGKRFLASLQEASQSADVAWRVQYAYAEYMLTMAMAWNRCYSEAINAALDLDQKYASSDHPLMQEVRAFALLVAAGCHAYLNQPTQGLLLLDQLEARAPGRYAEGIQEFRGLLERPRSEDVIDIQCSD